SRSEGATEDQSVSFAVQLRSTKNIGWIAHEHTTNHSWWSFRRRSYSSSRQRVRLASGKARAGVSRVAQSSRLPAVRGGYYSIHRRSRNPLDGLPAERHSERLPKNHHLHPERRELSLATPNSATAEEPWMTCSAGRGTPPTLKLQCGPFGEN